MAATSSTGSTVVGQSLIRTFHRPLLWVVLACLFGLDIITTSVSLELGYHEGNPLMVPFAADPILHGLVKIGAYLLLFGVIEQAVEFIRKKQPEAEQEPFWIRVNYLGLYGLIIAAQLWLIGLYSFVVINNIAILS
jgi:hypothetical protein